jgi:phage portal protein BeeE
MTAPRKRAGGSLTDQLLTLDGPPLGFSIGNLITNEEMLDRDYLGFAEQLYKANGIVFAVAAVRQLLLSEARFMWRKMRDGRPGDLFGNGELSLLERPWTNGTTGGLVMRMDMDATVGGNAYLTTAGGGRIGAASRGAPNRRIVRMRPDWVTILMGSNQDPQEMNPYALDREILAFIYDPPSSAERVILLPHEVAHYAPIPDPTATYRGMSWLTPIVREVLGDNAATDHKLAFFENGASPRLVAQMPEGLSPTKYKQFVQTFKETLEGATSAYKTLFFGGGADVKVVGADLRQLDFKSTQGAGETRIAAAGGVPASVVGISEGLQGSALNAGNYGSAKRRLADGTLRPLWRLMAGALETLIDSPGPDARLWYDDRDIPFLQEDAKDDADIRQVDANTMAALTREGWLPDSIVKAVRAGGDWTLLKHSGLYSVQLQPPGSVGGMDNNGDNGGGEPPVPPNNGNEGPDDGADED